jgi:hypothetical protein
MDKDEFFLRVAHALSGCQLVEQELKLYITEVLDLVRKWIAGRIPFKLSGEDYANSSLERLIEAFRKYSNNPTLVSELEEFKKERNFLSHKGITTCLDYEDELFYAAAADFSIRLQTIQLEAERIRKVIHEAARNLEVHWFDPIPDGGGSPANGDVRS